MRRLGRLSLAALAVVFVPLPAPAAQASPGMGWGQWTSPDLTFGECMSRSPKALKAEGMAPIEQHGRTWWGGSGSGDASAVIICYSLDRGAVVTIDAANEGDPGPSGALVGRLADRLFVDETPKATPGSVPIPKPAGPGSSTTPTATPAPIPSATTDPWGTSAESLRGKNGKRFTITCPPGKPGDAGHRLYGTGVYTDDSSPCTAAVYEGVISFAGGGKVTFEIRPGQGSYTGGSQNGVNSSTWGAWAGSFVLIRP